MKATLEGAVARPEQEKVRHDIGGSYPFEVFKIDRGVGDELLKLRSDNQRMTKALQKIESWSEFPESGHYYSDGSPISYVWAFGLNGERDYMRAVAREALNVGAAV